VLLGADRISPEGNVSNKIGSLAVSMMAATIRSSEERTPIWPSIIRYPRVLVVSDSDKIVAANKGEAEESPEMHPASELMDAWAEETRMTLDGNFERGTVEVFGEWFEWVPAQYINGYVTEEGRLYLDQVQKISREMGELKERFLT
jgi:translation initiation factor 2B subunit (eIF-2B alpha/beta/delta family)